MEDNKDNIIDIRNQEKNNNIINEEEENINLLNEKENNEGLNNIKYKDDNNIKFKESVLKSRNEIINKENNNKIIADYIIEIQYTKLFRIPYFIFGNIINLYCPFYKFKSEAIKLSQISTPPFTILINRCKNIIYLYNFDFILLDSSFISIFILSLFFSFIALTN